MIATFTSGQIVTQIQGRPGNVGRVGTVVSFHPPVVGSGGDALVGVDFGSGETTYVIRANIMLTGDLGDWRVTGGKWATGECQVAIDGGYAYVTAEQAERLSEQWCEIAQAIRALT